jgi:hypothetical protein
MQARVTLITLGVRDLDRAVRFYRDGLGWPMSSASSGDVAFFRTAGTIVALWPRHLLAEDAGLPNELSIFGGIALAHNVRTREEVDRVLALVFSIGGTILKPAHDTFWGGYSGYFADPEGHPWEVAWNPHWPLDDDGLIQLPD